MTNRWYISDNEYYPREELSSTLLLKPGIWVVHMSKEGMYLSYQSDCFTLPSKLYGLNNKFISYVTATWEANVRSNLGVLVSGIKGTGKTVSLKVLCNELKLPVIMVQSNFSSLTSFLEDKVQQDAIILIDEFEKIFTNSDDYDEDNGSLARLLSSMDGTSTSKYRRLYLFSTNSSRIDSNFINRPGRILFHNEYIELPEDVVVEIIDDLLHPENKEFRLDLIDVCGQLETLTIDAVVSLTSQVNIHKIPASEILPYLNLEKKIAKYSITTYLIQEEEVKPTPQLLGVFFDSQISFSKIEPHHIGDSFYINRTYYGEIVEVLDSGYFKLFLNTGRGNAETREAIGVVFKEDEEAIPITYCMKIEPKYESIFTGYYVV